MRARAPLVERMPRRVAWAALVVLLLCCTIHPSLPRLSALDRPDAPAPRLRALLDRLHAPYRIDPPPPAVDLPAPRAPAPVRRPPADPASLAAFPASLLQGRPLPAPQVADAAPSVERRTLRLRVVGLLRAGAGRPVQVMLEDGDGRTHFLAAGGRLGPVQVIEAGPERAVLRGPGGAARTARPGETLVFELPPERKEQR